MIISKFKKKVKLILKYVGMFFLLNIGEVIKRLFIFVSIRKNMYELFKNVLIIFVIRVFF